MRNPFLRNDSYAITQTSPSNQLFTFSFLLKQKKNVFKEPWKSFNNPWTKKQRARERHRINSSQKKDNNPRSNYRYIYIYILENSPSIKFSAFNIFSWLVSRERERRERDIEWLATIENKLRRMIPRSRCTYIYIYIHGGGWTRGSIAIAAE